MAQSLDSIIRDIFEAGFHDRCWSRGDSSVEEAFMNMEIPISGSSFEIPVFAWDSFAQAVASEVPDAIIVSLQRGPKVPRYVSLAKVMEDVLTQNYRYSRLVKMKISKLEETYYGTLGAIFDKDFKPVLMCSWKIAREGELYWLARPIVRIDPKCIINPEDAVEKFISKKFSPTALECRSIPFPNPVPHILSHARYEASLVVEKSPFVMKKGTAPSYSTTNNQLLQTALDYIDEVVSI